MILTNKNLFQKKNHITEICKGLYRIKIPLKGSPLRTLNSYLFKGADRNILIDTGYRMELCTETIKDSLAELGAHLENTDILLTHFHNDHSGAATDLIHPTRKIYVPSQEYHFFGIKTAADFYTESRRDRYLKEGISDQGFDDMMYANMFGSTNAKMGPDFFSMQFIPVEDKDTITVGDYALTAIHTPGHTPGHMCYWEETHGIMFTGDHILFDISPNIIYWPGVPNILGLYLYSLRKLDSYPVSLALPGHRNPGNLQVRIEEQRKHHEQRLNECESLVKLYPYKTALEITQLLSWKTRKPDGSRGLPLELLRYAYGECLCHLDHLRFSKRIDRVFKDGAYKYF